MTLIPLSETLRIVRETLSAPAHTLLEQVIVNRLSALAPVVEVPNALDALIERARQAYVGDGPFYGAPVHSVDEIAAARAELATLREFKKLAEEKAEGISLDDYESGYLECRLARYNAVASKEQA